MKSEAAGRSRRTLAHVNPEARYQRLVATLTTRYPGFAIVPKRASRLHRVIDRALRVVTFGQMRAYLDGYQTTLGRTVYVTDDWDTRDAAERYVTLRHEAVHVAQFARWTWPGMAVLYLLVPLPMGLALGRARLEQAAYEESIRAAAEVWGRAHVEDPAYRAHVLTQFTGPSYGWMWPFPRALLRWYDGVLARLPR